MEDLIKLFDVKNVLICSFVSWGVIQAVKPLVWRFIPDSFASSTLRLLAILVGAGVGFGLESSPYGAGIGAACGAMSTFTVALIKKLVSSKAKVDLKELESGDAEKTVEEDA